MRTLLGLVMLTGILFHASIAQETTNEKFVGSVIESNPEFPGGLEKFFEYVFKKCPKSEKHKGKVFVSFFVETDGKITEPKIVKGLEPEFDKKMLAALEAMPLWKAAVLKGEPIRKKVVMNIDY